MTRAKDHGFITEAEVIETWPMIPATAIRRARRTGKLAFYQFPGGPHYRRRDVEAFIEAKYRRGPPPAVRMDASPPTSADPTPIVPSETFKPARPVALSPKGYETMAAEEARLQREALAKRSKDKAAPFAASPTGHVEGPSHPHSETREEEIDRLRSEVFADRIRSRRSDARKAKAVASAKSVKPKATKRAHLRTKAENP